MKIINLLIECARLKKATKSEADVENMTEEERLYFLAKGVEDGWYGNEMVQEAILGNLYEPVKEKVKE